MMVLFVFLLFWAEDELCLILFCCCWHRKFVCIQFIWTEFIHSNQIIQSKRTIQTDWTKIQLNRQRYAYIVIPEKDESKNGHISLFFFSFTDKLSRYFWTPKLRFKILYPWPLGYWNNLYHWSIFGQIGHFIPELQ